MDNWKSTESGKARHHTASRTASLRTPWHRATALVRDGEGFRKSVYERSRNGKKCCGGSQSENAPQVLPSASLTNALVAKFYNVSPCAKASGGWLSALISNDLSQKREAGAMSRAVNADIVSNLKGEAENRARTQKCGVPMFPPLACNHGPDLRGRMIMQSTT